MRVIAGKHRGRILKSPPNLKIRPTSDRLRETLFNILNPRLDKETIFLDLCAGTGAVGIEALSREIKFCAFVDKSRKSCALVESNLDLLEIPEDRRQVFQKSAAEFLQKSAGKTYDVIFYDPPYQEDYAEVFKILGTPGSQILARDGVFIAEHLVKKNLPDEIGSLRRWRLLKQGDSALSFYEKN